MEGVSHNLALAKVESFYRAQGCSWAGREELYRSLRSWQLPRGTVAGLPAEPIDRDLVVHKFLVIEKYLWLLALVPFSRMFFLAGSLACGNPRPESDIDLVVVAKKNRVWLNRLLLLSVTALFGRRRNRKKTADRFCFNWSLDETEPVFFNQDFVSAHFYKHLVPLWSSGGTSVKQFWRANGWIKSYAPLFPFPTEPLFDQPGGRLVGRIRGLAERIIEFSGLATILESAARKIQTIYINRRLKMAGPSPKKTLILRENLVHYHFPQSRWVRQQNAMNEMIKKI